jgi:NAD(P)-dependent dehydrogenase (short-subunit alcohol dehydrogenase family)
MALVEAGARVACVDSNSDACGDSVALAASNAVVVRGDLLDISDFTSLINRAEDAIGPLDGLANLAAVLRRLAITDVTEDDWDAHLNVNAKASFFLGRAFAEHLKGEGRQGAVAFAASQSWWSGGLDGSVVYAASKGALVSLTRGLARQYAPAGIRFNTVAPGFVDTPMLHRGLDDAAMDRMLAAVPMGRLATSEEVANAMSFLVSRASSYITGATLVIAGGQLMY